MSYDYSVPAQMVLEKTKVPFTPDEVKEFFVYLDVLRESGVTNMYGARPYLVEEFELEPRVAGAVLGAWMKTFGERHLN